MYLDILRKYNLFIGIPKYEIRQLHFCNCLIIRSGDSRSRTDDPLLAKQML